MPRYEYRCRSCELTFELNRPMTDSSAPTTCPRGHKDTVRLLSAVAVGGTTASPAPTEGGGGGCCS
jgi:putative FmdB family regulatory protein